MSYIYDLTDTWNNVATTFTAVKMNVTDTASAAGSLLMDLQVGGVSRFSVRKDGYTVLGPMLSSNVFGSNITSSNEFILSSATSLKWASSGLATPDTILTRDAANTLAQRNGTNAQTFRLYNTYTDASNYERADLGWSSNEFFVGTGKAGTGSGRALVLRTNGSSRFFLQATDGHLLASTDNTYDIGASGANRPRAIYSGLSISAGSTLNYGNNRGLVSTNFGTSIGSPADGVVLMTDNAQTSFGRLQFGGTTSSFPSLKRNATALETKLADDSAYAPHAMQFLDVTDGITAPAAATGRARIYVDTADGDLKVIFADGTIKTIVTDT